MKTKLILDVNKTQYAQLNSIVTGRVGDKAGNTVDVYVVDGFVPYNLTGSDVYFECAKPDNTSVRDKNGIVMIDAAKGHFEYTFPAQTFAAIGKSKQAYFTVEKNSTVKATTQDFIIVSIPDALTNRIPSQTYISQLEELIWQLEQIELDLLNSAAYREAHDAKIFAEQAKAISESVQEQLNQIVIQGSIDPETKQARVDENGVAHNTLKERIDFDSFRISNLFDKSNFISIKEYKNLKIAITEGYDWSPAISKAISDAKTTKKMLVLHADEDMWITTPIVPSPDSKIGGFGKYASNIRIKGAIKAIDLSDVQAKVGLELFSLCIKGNRTSGQIGIDANYLVNGSVISNIRIEEVDTGIIIQKAWYCSLSDIFIKGCLNYGMHVKSISADDQVNALDFRSIFIQDAKNCVFLDGVNVSSAIKFDSCTFESSRKTAVISNRFSPLKFVNCYFERNYVDATTTDTLTWDTPIDVKVTGTTTRNVVKFDACYFARRNNFLPSSQKCSIYLGGNVKATFDSLQFVCNTSAYIDANVYSVSSFPPFINQCSEDGYAKQMYNGVTIDKITATNNSANLRYASTSYIVTPITRKNEMHYFRFSPFVSKTVTAIPTFRVTNYETNATIKDISLGTTNFVAGKSIEMDLGGINANIIQLSLINPSGSTPTDEVTGSIQIYRKSTL